MLDVEGKIKTLTVKCDSLGDIHMYLDDLPLSVREWVCPECSSVHDREINAAIDILRVGASTLAGEGVRPVSASILR